MSRQALPGAPGISALSRQAADFRLSVQMPNAVSPNRRIFAACLDCAFFIGFIAPNVAKRCCEEAQKRLAAFLLLMNPAKISQGPYRKGVLLESRAQMTRP